MPAKPSTSREIPCQRWKNTFRLFMKLARFGSPSKGNHCSVLHTKSSRETVFCFDNESFRFLCAWQQGARFKDEEVENFNTSWTTTVEETFRLFKRIAELPSHKTEDTLSVNNIRKVILAMARPLAEIAKNQMTNAQLIDEKIKEVEDLQQQGKTLSTAQLYVDQVILYLKL